MYEGINMAITTFIAKFIIIIINEVCFFFFFGYIYIHFLFKGLWVYRKLLDRIKGGRRGVTLASGVGKTATMRGIDGSSDGKGSNNEGVPAKMAPDNGYEQ